VRRKTIDSDSRVKKKRSLWKASLLTFIILLVLSSGQAMILAEYMRPNPIIPDEIPRIYDVFPKNIMRPEILVPAEFIFGSIGYWAIVAAVFTLVTHYQTKKHFNTPLRRLSQAAKDVAGGDFSIYVEPTHTPDKYDYTDILFVDFNTMVEELGSIETLKNDFIANVSHEIKTPLAVIQNYATLIKDEKLAPNKRDEYADTIISASSRLNSLVSNILKLNKLENTEIQTSAEDYDLCRQLCDCALNFEDMWEEKNIEFDVDIEDRAIIHANKEMMEIVWHNLFSNALKFTEPGGKVTLAQTSNADAVTVTVSDTGCGMNEDVLKRIFDKFYQGDTSHSQEGNGLGLALSLRVIELVGGSISVKSEPDKGSTFTVRLKPRNDQSVIPRANIII